jgi:hypothetical protein
MIAPLHSTSLLFLVGGGRSPRYPPNKVVFWDDAIGKEVAELEFRERVRGLACRRECLAVALRRRVVVFKFTNTIERIAEWDTSDNERGLSLLPYPCHRIPPMGGLMCFDYVRLTGSRYWTLFYSSCYAGSSDWSSSVCPSSPMPPASPVVAARRNPTKATTVSRATEEAPGFTYNGTHISSCDDCDDALREICCYYLCPRYSNTNMGFTNWTQTVRV